MTTLADLQSQRAQQVVYKAGQAFSQVLLPSADDGSALSLAQFHGQKLLLHIFASW